MFAKEKGMCYTGPRSVCLQRKGKRVASDLSGYAVRAAAEVFLRQKEKQR